MLPAYALCATERGGGMFERMKSHMNMHTHLVKEGMFTDTTRHLLQLLANLKVRLKAKLKQDIPSDNLQYRTSLINVVFTIYTVFTSGVNTTIHKLRVSEQ